MKFAIFWILGLNFGLAVSINWNGNWAFACDFKGNNIGNAQVSVKMLPMGVQREGG